ncbi:MAG: hypothetical protein J0I65_24925 [Variovorax sp.]|nr:hypothetical protein [Variovorax sp.]
MVSPLLLMTGLAAMPAAGTSLLLNAEGGLRRAHRLVRVQGKLRPTRRVHSMQLRQQVFRAKRERQLEFGAGQSPIEAFLALRRKRAGKRRRAASDVAQVQREREAARKTSATDEATSSGDSPVPLPLVAGPVKGKALRIARGYAR